MTGVQTCALPICTESLGVGTQGASIENDFYKITAKDNKVELLIKRTGEIVADVFSIETSGDAGDSYDYSPPHKDIIINSEDSKITKIESLKGSNQEILKYRVSYNLPKDQVSRDLNKLDKEVYFDVTLTLSSNDIIKVDLEHTNSLKDTRFRAVLNTNIKTDKVECDSHLSVIENPVYFEKELSIWEEDKWAEKPVSIETFNSYVALEEAEKRATIFSYGLKEYEVVDKKIFVTLFRSFSHLGKRELINRPGRPSGIEIETPDNQLLGEKFKFNLAISFVKNLKNDSVKAKEFLTPITGYQLKEFNRFNINTPKIKTLIESKLNLDLNGCVISTLKEAEDSENIFIRIFNPNKHNIELNFVNEVYKSNMFEQKLEKLQKYNVKSQEILNIII